MRLSERSGILRADVIKKKAFYVKQSWGVDEATEEKSKERQNAPEKIREERKK